MGAPVPPMADPAHTVLHQLSHLVPGGWTTILLCTLAGTLVVFRKKLKQWLE